jgi:hypothetical protein
MAVEGEKYIEYVFNEQGYKIEEKVCGEDVFASKENLGIVVEEKDWKDPVKVYRNRIKQIGVNGKEYTHDRSQITQYGFQIKKRDMQKGVYRFIICAFVFSNLLGRKVQPIYFRKFGTIFCVSKEYFPVWLKSLERTYLGMDSIIDRDMYMGGV